MSLDLVGRTSVDPSIHVFKISLVFIGLWTLWLIGISTWHLPLGIVLPGTAFVLVFGGYWWNMTEGLAYLLLMSWIFSGISFVPPGFFWVSAFCVFLTIKVLSIRLSLRAPIELGLAIIMTALLLDIIQTFLLSEIITNVNQIWSFRLFGSMLLSAILQGGLSLIVARPLMALLAAK